MNPTRLTGGSQDIENIAIDRLAEAEMLCKNLSPEQLRVVLALMVGVGLKVRCVDYEMCVGEMERLRNEITRLEGVIARGRRR